MSTEPPITEDEFEANFKARFLEIVPSQFAGLRDELKSRIAARQLTAFYGDDDNGNGARARESLSDVGRDIFRATDASVLNAQPDIDNLPGVPGAPAYVKQLGGDDGQGGLRPLANYEAALEKVRPLADVLASYFKKTVDASNTKFAFWSGKPAKLAAAASGATSLEGSSLGGLFDGIKLPNQNMALWGAISEAYAAAALEQMDTAEYIGFVGVGADRQQSVYNVIEKPTFTDITGAANRQIPVTWFAVVPPQRAYKNKDNDPLEELDNTLNGAGYTGVIGGANQDRSDAVDLMKREHDRRTAVERARVNPGGAGSASP